MSKGTDDPKHNISRDDAFVLFQISKVEEHQKRKNTTNGEFSARLETAEANGLNKWAIKEALKIKKKGEIAETVTRLSALLRYLRLLGLPLDSKQIDMFEVAPKSQPITENAYEQGFGTGVVGEGQDKNDHAPGTDAFNAWMKGFHAGCEARRGFLSEEGKAAAEAPEDSGQGDVEDDA